MKKWFVSIPVSANASFHVEAETMDEAIQKAYDEGVPRLCWSCSNDLELGEFGDYSEPYAEPE